MDTKEELERHLLNAKARYEWLRNLVAGESTEGSAESYWRYVDEIFMERPAAHGGGGCFTLKFRAAARCKDADEEDSDISETGNGVSARKLERPQAGR